MVTEDLWACLTKIIAKTAGKVFSDGQFSSKEEHGDQRRKNGWEEKIIRWNVPPSPSLPSFLPLLFFLASFHFSVSFPFLFFCAILSKFSKFSIVWFPLSIAFSIKYQLRAHLIYQSLPQPHLRSLAPEHSITDTCSVVRSPHTATHTSYWM